MALCIGMTMISARNFSARLLREPRSLFGRCEQKNKRRDYQYHQQI